MKNYSRRIAVVALALLATFACGTPAAPAAPATLTPTTTDLSSTPSALAAPAAVTQVPQLGGCPIFPADNIWNTPIDTLPVDPNSDAYINSIGANTAFHPDFGSDPTYGIPFNIVPAGQPAVNVTFDYDDESDPGPYPIPPNPRIEAGGDRHILIIEQGTCKLYETWDTSQNQDGTWRAGSGAIFDLRSNALRPDGWTSADAAGLPILPGLVRRDEVLAGEINHALRFTAEDTRRSYIWPARHFASDITDPNVPPMGQYFRLKASFDISGFPPYDQVILTALKKYGMILADNGSNWYVSGTNDTNWDDDALNMLKDLRGSDFEAVDVSSLQVDPDSAQVATGPQDTKTVTPSGAQQGQQVAYSIQLVGTNTPMMLNDPLPTEITMVNGSLNTTGSTSAAGYSGGAVTWNGAPETGTIVTISYAATLETAATTVIRNTATVTRGDGQQELTALLIANPLQTFLPLARR